MRTCSGFVGRKAGRTTRGLGVAAALALGLLGCGGAGPVTDGSAHALIGPEGGQIVGAAGSALAGVKLVVPAGALASAVDVTIRPAADDTPLPATALRCGPQFEIGPVGTQLALPAQVTLPYDPAIVADSLRFADEVKVWVLDAGKWGQRLQTDGTDGSVTVEVTSLSRLAAGVNPPAEADVVKFDLHPNPKFLPCFAAYPNDPSRAPSAQVTVVRGTDNDALFLRGRHLKPGLQFDLFTVENTSLLPGGAVDPAFKNFGMAWYQSDVHVRDEGEARTTIRTILLDQIFGFDPAVGLVPTGTFHVGFWFNNPNDAAACGFDPAKPTPFNGDHAAGPLAMITVADGKTNLGPLCTKPDTSVIPARCSP